MRVATHPLAAEQRRTPRHEVNFAATVHRDSGPKLKIHVVDISEGGLMARSSVAFMPGEQVLIELPHVGRREALVRWSLGGRAGCELVKPLPEAVCRRIVNDPPPPPSPWVRF